MADSYTFKVRFMDDRDPFTVAYAEPTVPPTFTFTKDDPLIEQIPRLIKTLNAPHQVEEAAVQVSLDNSYLDLDSSIVDICENGNLDPKNRKTILILRSSLSVRVCNCCETLQKSTGRDLRKALFSLKRIFKDDQDLVHCFVDRGGLDTLVNVGEDADHNYIIYIIRALGEVMVYVDGMQGIIKHQRTIQWLYVLVTKYGNQSIMLVKGCLELLLVFINYKEDVNSNLVVKAVHAVDAKQGKTPWNGFMAILKEGLSNSECFLYSITLINKVLSNVVSQDTFYDITDALEKQEIDTVHREVLAKDAESEIVEKIQLQINAYNVQLKAEDDENSDPADQNAPDRNRKTRRSSVMQDRGSIHSINAHEAVKVKASDVTAEDEMIMVTPTMVENGGNDWSKRAEIMDSNLGPPPPPQKNDTARLAMIQDRREKAEKRLHRRRTLLNSKSEEDKKPREDRLEDVVQAVQKEHNGHLSAQDNELLKNSTNTSWSRLKNKIDVIKSMRKSEPVDTGRDKEEKAEVVNENCILLEELNDEEEKPHFDLASLSRPTTFDVNNSSLSIKNHKFHDLGDKDDLDIKTVIVNKPAQPVAPAACLDTLRCRPLPPGAPPPPPLQLGVPPPPPLQLGVPTPPPGVPPPPPGAPPPPSAPPLPPGAPPVPLGVRQYTRTLGAPPTSPGASPAPPRPPGAPPAPPRPPGAPPAPPRTTSVPLAPRAPPTPGTIRPPGAPPAPPCSPGTPQFHISSSDDVGTLKRVPNKNDLVKVFWNKVALNKTTGLPPSIPFHAAQQLEGTKSIWKERPPVKVDYDLLTILFTKKKVESKKSLDIEKAAPVKVIRVLEGNRSREVGIAMAKLPAARHIKQAVLNMDPSHITRESIASLAKLLPTEEEKNQITEAKLANPDIPLGKEEDYVHTLSVIPNVKCRLDIWAFMIDFDAMEDEVADYLMDLKECCNELQSCSTLHLIISYLLEIGNFLRQEKNDGFDINFLSKVADIKDTVKKQTLIHHIAAMMHENHPSQGDLHKEIKHTHRIGRVSFDEVELTMAKMDEQCDNSWEDLRTISKHTTSTNDVMQKQLAFLKCVAERINILRLVMRRVKNRYYALLLYFGVNPAKKFITPDEFCRTISEFALEYRTAIEAVIQEQAKIKKMKERRKTRGIKITDLKQAETEINKNNNKNNTCTNNVDLKPKKLLSRTKNMEAENHDTPEEVTASLEDALQSEKPRKRTRHRLKSKMAQRKSLRRTLKSGITEDDMLAAGIK